MGSRDRGGEANVANQERRKARERKAHLVGLWVPGEGKKQLGTGNPSRSSSSSSSSSKEGLWSRRGGVCCCRCRCRPPRMTRSPFGQKTLPATVGKGKSWILLDRHGFIWLPNQEGELLAVIQLQIMAFLSKELNSRGVFEQNNRSSEAEA